VPPLDAFDWVTGESERGVRRRTDGGGWEWDKDAASAGEGTGAWLAGGRVGRVFRAASGHGSRARGCQVRGVGSRVTAEVVAVGRLAFWRRKRKKRERRVGEGREDFTSLDGWMEGLAWIGWLRAARSRGG
jgi:hypothetical protein